MWRGLCAFLSRVLCPVGTVGGGRLALYWGRVVVVLLTSRESRARVGDRLSGRGHSHGHSRLTLLTCCVRRCREYVFLVHDRTTHSAQRARSALYRGSPALHLHVRCQIKILVKLWCLLFFFLCYTHVSYVNCIRICTTCLLLFLLCVCLYICILHIIP